MTPAQSHKGLSRGEISVAVFTAAYMLGALFWFLSVGNREFVWYLVTMVLLVALVGWTARAARAPVWLLWALSVWGLAHMAGGGLVIDGAVLYAKTVIPIVGEGEARILKYDQVVHFYGFAVTALFLRSILLGAHPALKGSTASYVYPALASLGLSAVNEIVEFAAVMGLPDTNVGGYVNTGLDLVFNAAGATAAMVAVRLVTGPGSGAKG
jgi:hypothetical protein